MSQYTQLEGSLKATPSAAAFWREEHRQWHLRLDDTGGHVRGRVYRFEADAVADTGNHQAEGVVSLADGQLALLVLSTTGLAPKFGSFASVLVSLEEASPGASCVWRVDLGPQMQRCHLRILRHVRDLMVPANGYAFIPRVVELGNATTSVLNVASNNVPYVVVDHGAYDLAFDEKSGGAITHTLDFRLLAVLAVSGRTDNRGAPDVNAMWALHDLRRALVAARRQPYLGDGSIISALSVVYARPDTPDPGENVVVACDIAARINETKDGVNAA